VYVRADVVRFYGESQPFEDLTTSHLKYLSTPQALADADNFVRSFVFSKHGANTKVVSFGGSCEEIRRPLLLRDG
jgi:hypothetical protein